ncbi:hypothetical protein P5V47_00505 [Mycobacteroides abscessus subsp. massiliense]|uniref:ApeA N-terminal domain 1-containing protein n=1 Tax=Mycobacteroides abscessus TaxID=36809 RepID=UPI00266C4FF1|nr:HEPN domain-containing protein [Mycobacteroides abscessus]MDO3297169.1 hypothetical protein [Mycobacteroides abscessus subsp. massiliense]
MGNRLDEIMDGTAGHFWTDLSDGTDLNRASAGYVRLRDDIRFDIETLTTKDVIKLRGPRQDAGPITLPEAIFAATHSAGCVFFDHCGYSASSIVAATRASTQTYKTRAVLAGLNLNDIASANFTRFQVKFPEVIYWSGLGGVHEETETDSQGRVQSYKAQLRSANPRVSPQRRGITIALSSKWSASGPRDGRLISNPLTVTTQSNRPKSWWDHIQPILAVQDLINLAYKGFVPASDGTADIETKSGEKHTRSPELWSSRLMVVPKGSERPKKMMEIPVFNLRDIGGIRGIDGWIELDRKFPRATGPLAKVYRIGNLLAIETRLIEVAVAIEYYVGIHRRGSAWASKANGHYTLALAKHAGPTFQDFVGDAKKWADLFKDTYNSLKHDPRFSYDSDDIATLAQSGEILLQSVLLNRIARNKRMTSTICESHRNYRVGEDAKDLVGRGHI